MLVALAIAQCLTFAAPADAPAADAVAALPVRIDAPMSDPDRAAIGERFADGLRRSGFDVRPAAGEDTATCSAADCYRDIADQSATPLLAGGAIGRDGPDYTVKAFIVSGDTGEVVAEVDGVCEICGVQELGDMVEGLVARLRSKAGAATAPTRLTVDSDPPGATVRIDGEEVGETPLTVIVTSGPHEIEVERPGYRVERTQADLRQGVTETFSYRLARDRARGGASKIPRWLPWTLLGVGAGTMVSGIVLVAIHDRPIKRDCNADSAGNCQFLHDTLGGGVALTVTGIALVGTGIALAIVRQRRGGNDRVQAGAAWLPGPGLTLRARF